MKHFIVYFTSYAATGLAIGYFPDISARDSYAISRHLWTRRTDNRKLPSNSRLVRRGSRDHPKTSANTRPSSGKSYRPSASSTAASAAASSLPGSNTLSPNQSRPKSALTTELQEQKDVADRGYAQISNPKKTLATLAANYRSPLGREIGQPFGAISPKNIAATHHAAAYTLSKERSHNNAHASRLHAIEAVRAAQEASGNEVEPAEKYAIVAHQHADRANRESQLSTGRMPYWPSMSR